MIDLLLVLGIVVVCPLALRSPWVPWLAAGCSAAVALQLPTGPVAGALALPWVVVAGRTAFDLLPAGRRPWDLVVPLAAVYAVVGSLALVASRLGVSAFGIEEPIVELTAVHYTYAGCGALVLAVAAAHRRSSVGQVAVALTAGAPPIVALGFFTHSALPQVGGAVLLTLGVWLTAGLQLRDAAGVGWGRRRVLLGISGLAVWAPMVLAVLWAAGQHWAVPALSVPAMARTHGVTNAVAFVVCGLLGRRVPVRVLEGARS